MTPAEFRVFRTRLANLGLELAADARFISRTLDFDLTEPHTVLCLDRVSVVGRPHYTISAFVECALCNELCYLDHWENSLMKTSRVLPLCNECQPADLPFPLGMLN